MGSLSNYAENLLLNHILNASQTAPANRYVALCTADPLDTATGASMSETANSNGYARTAITFSAATARRVTQSADISFPAASGNWAAPITYWTVVDSATYGAGNVLATGQFVSSFQPVTGNTPTIPTALQEIYIQINASSGAGLSDYAVHRLLDYFFRNVAFSSTAGSTYIALSSSGLDDQDVLNTDFTETTGTGYARKLVEANGGTSPTWAAVSGGATSNAAAIDFGTVGSGGWGSLVAMAILDSVSGAGNVLGFDTTNIDDQVMNVNDVVRFNSGQLAISLS